MLMGESSQPPLTLKFLCGQGVQNVCIGVDDVCITVDGYVDSPRGHALNLGIKIFESVSLCGGEGFEQ